MSRPLEFVFHPSTSTDCDAPPTFSGEGQLLLRIEGDAYWRDESKGEAVGVTDFWDGLLHHLARHWHHLRAEQTYPLGHEMKSPADFLDRALQELRWGEDSDDEVANQEEEIFSFSNRHNLASGMSAIHLPPVYLLREGSDMRLVAEDHDILIPLEEAMATLESLGNHIAQAVSAQSSRGKLYLEMWEKRNQPLPDATILSIVTGMTEQRVFDLAANDDIDKIFGPPSLNTPGPIQIAARMTQHKLFDKDLQEVLARVAKLQMVLMDGKFLKLRPQAVNFMEEVKSEPAFDQGYQLARWLRKSLKMNDDASVDPEQLLAMWKIDVVNTKVSEEIDAIARWDGNMAGILINGNGKHAKKKWGRRASLAHEIAHLLVDTDHALPSVEILGGRMPLFVEQRASAFAAEFLLPQSQVAHALPDTFSQDAYIAAIRRLADKFNVGLLLSAHQIKNYLVSQSKLDPPCRAFFDVFTNRYGSPSNNNWLRL